MKIDINRSQVAVVRYYDATVEIEGITIPATIMETFQEGSGYFEPEIILEDRNYEISKSIDEIKSLIIEKFNKNGRTN